MRKVPHCRSTTSHHSDFSALRHDVLKRFKRSIIIQREVGRNLDCAKGGICRSGAPHQYRYQNVSLFPLRDLAKGPPSEERE
jgi:hypothetical protein